MITPADASLAGKTAIVTGAARGIGRAIALGLASFGADVAICDRDESSQAETVALLEGIGRPPLVEVLDVRDPDAVQTFVGRVVDARGQVDVLVNNAAGTFYAHFFDTSPKGQATMVDENFVSVTHCIRAAVPVMPAGGSIINVTSIEAHRAAPGFGVYAAMKAAVTSLTKTLALELAPRGIRVNAIAPDAIRTPGDEGLAESVTQGDTQAYGRKVPLDWGETDDCAGAAVYLASRLSKWVTGTVLHVDGGSLASSGWIRRDDGTYEP
ncbi:MAG: SDR family oxidoreductase [Acidimicrobiia bacterium]|jgi:NAD(P)-dependent dehydrogenase (short-subunit alcohol dehydrogenase family)